MLNPLASLTMLTSIYKPCLVNFTAEKPKKYHAWSCQNICAALIFLFDNIFIRFGTKLYRQVFGIIMGTNFVPLVAHLLIFCYERTLRCLFLMIRRVILLMLFTLHLGDILKINNVYFDNMVSQIYPSELQPT